MCVQLLSVPEWTVQKKKETIGLPLKATFQTSLKSVSNLKLTENKEHKQTSAEAAVTLTSKVTWFGSSPKI